MKEKLVLSVLVDNESGVLQRIASLFSRRAYNISSLTVSETEDEIDEKFGIVELARTGITSLQRGEGSFTEDI